MSGKIKFVRAGEGGRSEFDGLVQQRSLAALATGATDMLFEHAVMENGLVVDGVVNETQDEYVYVISGVLQITCEGETHDFDEGSFFFCPRGTSYDMKVEKGTTEVIGVFPPGD